MAATSRRLSASEILERRHQRQVDLDEETAKWEREFEEQRARRVALRQRTQQQSHSTLDEEKLRVERQEFEQRRQREVEERAREEEKRRQAAQREAEELNLKRERELEANRNRNNNNKSNNSSSNSGSSNLSDTQSVDVRLAARRRARQEEDRKAIELADQRNKEREAKRRAREEERKREDEAAAAAAAAARERSSSLKPTPPPPSSTIPSPTPLLPVTHLPSDKETASTQKEERISLSVKALDSKKSSAIDGGGHSKQGKEKKEEKTERPAGGAQHPLSSTEGTKWYTKLSTIDRPFAEVPMPESRVLDERDLLLKLENDDHHAEYDTALLARHFASQGRVTAAFALGVVSRATALLRSEPNMLKLRAPCVVVGDVHGQYFDLLELFRVAGDPLLETNQYLFLGDYVDRGFFSFETLMLLLCAKLNAPSRVALLRGNHETRAMNKMHSFASEVAYKLRGVSDAYDRIAELFDALPISAVVECASLGNVFCVHGGIAQEALTLDAIQSKITRGMEPEDDSALLDMLWSDPLPEESPSQLWKENAKRGAGVQFGYDVLSDFLDTNALTMLVRAHQVQQDGYKELWYRKWNPDARTPKLVTLFSAPNYCDKYGNQGAFMILRDDEYVIKTFAWQDHPYVMPTFQSAFTFSLPFVAENVMKFLLGIMQVLHGVELDEEKEEESKLAEMQRLATAAAQQQQQEQQRQEQEARQEVKVAAQNKARQTLRQAARVMLQFKQLREENEQLIAPLKLSALSREHDERRRASTTTITQEATSESRRAWFEAVVAEDERNEALDNDLHPVDDDAHSRMVKEGGVVEVQSKSLPMRRTRSFKF